MIKSISAFRVVTGTLLVVLLSVELRSAEAQAISIADDAFIKLERTSCFGECPVYTVSIDAHGNVVYEGAMFVRVEGRQTDRIALARVAEILETARRIGFFELRDQYRSIQNPDGTETVVSDLPTAFITITYKGRSKRVENYIGAPEGLKQLEQQIDGAAATKQWILLDERTLQELVRQGWSPTPAERAEFLRKAVQHDEVGVVKGLLDFGADPNWPYFGTNTPLLMMIRSVAAARLLLSAGANPFARNDNGYTPLYWSVHLEPEVAELLLQAGARVDEPIDVDSGTALWNAACRGNVGVVSVLLRAGADPSVRAARGQSALECTREARDAQRLRNPSVLDSKPPYLQDFDQVIMLLEQALAKPARR